MDRTCVVILGMHRSGTSALAGTLAALGVDFGDDLIGANAGNPKGHFEMTAAVEFNDRLLRHFRARWKRSFRWPADGMTRLPREFDSFAETLAIPDSPLWGLKDPRLCRLVPPWREILRRRGCAPKFVICVRQPAEVAASLAQRDNLPKDLAATLWLEHLCAAEADTRTESRLFLTHSELMANPGKIAQDLSGFLELPAPNAEQLSEISRFLDPRLRRQNGGELHLPIAGRLYELAAARKVDELSACVDEIRALQSLREEAVRTERHSDSVRRFPKRWMRFR